MSSTNDTTVSTTTSTTTTIPSTSIDNDRNDLDSSSSSGGGLLHRMVDAVKSHLPSLPHSTSDDHSASSYHPPSSATSITQSKERSDGAVWSNMVSTDPSSAIPIGSYPPPPDNAASSTPSEEYSLPAHRSKLSEKVEEGIEGVKEKSHELNEKALDQYEAIRMEAGEIRREAGEKAGGLMDTLKEKLHNFHPFSSSDSTTTTTTTTATIPVSTSDAIPAGSRRESAGLSEKEKEEMDKFPTKYDRQGDIETFKKHVHTAYERGLGLDAVRDDRHYTREFPQSTSSDSSSDSSSITTETTKTTTTNPSSSFSSSSPSIPSSLEHVSTVPLASSTPFPDDVPTADPMLEFPSKDEMSQKVEEMGEKADERMEAMKEKTGEKVGGLMENLKEDFRYAKERLHEAGEHLRHPSSTRKDEKTERTVTIESTGTETGMGPGPV